jgi:transposase
MAKIQFKSYPQGQTVLFLSDLGENIPENDPVRIVSRIVDGLNIDSLIETYEAFGCPPIIP